MTNQTAKAYINLNGVLRCLPYVCALDQDAKERIQGRNLTIQFKVRNGPIARLVFENGVCRFEKGKGKSQIKLNFSSPEHFNRMMEGRANPSISKGLLKIGFLTKEFMQLTKRMEYYLKPNPALLADASFRRINTILTFYVAFHSLAEVGMHDPVGVQVMKHAKRGALIAAIEQTDVMVRLKLSPGNIEVAAVDDDSPVCKLRFASVDKAYEVLSGKLDFLTAIGFGDVRMEGFMPVMQTVEHILPMVNTYLA
ncbi:MAG: SCP2 sterol-binding domain-containing protein [Eubacteriales bacterium]|nr:SCP2 sterol-binding domain-containing protein [Eubacteriales bacterium]